MKRRNRVLQEQVAARTSELAHKNEVLQKALGELQHTKHELEDANSRLSRRAGPRAASWPT